MLKKSLIIVSLFALMLFISTPVFASNMMQGAENTLNNIKGGVQNMTKDAGNAMEHAKDDISNVASDIKDGAQNMGSDIKRGTDNVGRDIRNDGYTASRTSATGMLGGTSNYNTALVWVVLAVTGAIIIALVWYYGSQVNTRRR